MVLGRELRGDLPKDSLHGLAAFAFSLGIVEDQFDRLTRLRRQRSQQFLSL